MRAASMVPRKPMDITGTNLAKLGALTARCQQAYPPRVFHQMGQLAELATRVDRALVVDYLLARGDVPKEAIDAVADLADRDWVSYHEATPPPVNDA